MFIQTETYPIVLLNDAVRLVEQAKAGKSERSNDGRNIPSPSERAFSRAAIFTSFNFLEGLLIELAQDRIKVGPTHCPHCNNTIQDDLKSARAEISRTLREWPTMLLGKCLLGMSEFGAFREIRVFRNHLIHPKYERFESHEPSQDDLLKECTSFKAEWILSEICKMAEILYREFGKATPPELRQVLERENPRSCP